METAKELSERSKKEELPPSLIMFKGDIIEGGEVVVIPLPPDPEAAAQTIIEMKSEYFIIIGPKDFQRWIQTATERLKKLEG